MNMENHGGMILTGENRRNRERPVRVPLLFTTNFTWTDPGLSPLRLGFAPGSICMGFVVDKAALEQGFSPRF
jgi:hypothetical protein